MKALHLVLSLLILSLNVIQITYAQINPESPLEFVEAFLQDDLGGVIAVGISPDGKHLYAASYRASTITVFERDMEYGTLNHIQTYHAQNLQGAACARVSPNGKYVVSVGFVSNTISLYKRDPASGELTLLDSMPEGYRGNNKFTWAVDAIYSYDSDFIYALAADSRTVTCFQIQNDKLYHMQTLDGKSNAFANCRGIVLHPNGKWIYVVSSDAGTLVTLSADPFTGMMTYKSTLHHRKDSLASLSGVMGITCSPDGKQLYTASGRIRGSHTLAVWSIQEDGTPDLLQEIKKNRIAGLEGGNEIIVTPNGKHVFSAGTLAHSLNMFERNASNGKLTHLKTYTTELKNPYLLNMASGIACSPDGKFIYVAAEKDDALNVFQVNE